MTSEGHDEKVFSVGRAQRYVREEASMRRRIVYTLLLLVDVGAVVLLVALWSTEPQLPQRTHAAFGTLLGIGIAWLVFFGWVLTRRRPLFALDTVVAGVLAVAFTALFLLGGVAIAVQRGHWPGTLAVALVGGMFMAAAAAVLVRAVRTRRRLLRRRDELTAHAAGQESA